MSKIGKDFQPEHMKEALEARGVNHEEILKGASGGSSASKWGEAGGAAAVGAAGAAA